MPAVKQRVTNNNLVRPTREYIERQLIDADAETGVINSFWAHCHGFKGVMITWIVDALTDVARLDLEYEEPMTKNVYALPHCFIEVSAPGVYRLTVYPGIRELDAKVTGEPETWYLHGGPMTNRRISTLLPTTWRASIDTDVNITCKVSAQLYV